MATRRWQSGLGSDELRGDKMERADFGRHKIPGSSWVGAPVREVSEVGW